MQLDRLSVALRPRNSWEAIDLGFQMARARFWRLWLLWWMSALPVTLLLALGLHQYPEFIASAIWWFKPLYEPALLYWLSRALFNEDLSLREVRRDWWKVTRRRLPGNLLWRRFSLNRSMFMPIALLEQPDNAAYKERRRVFTRGFSGGGWLTVIGVHLEGVINLSLIFGIAMLVPDELLPRWEWHDWFDDSNAWLSWAWALAGVFAMSLIAPFYVAGGFGLYLSRRTGLEGWDLELSFRRLVEKLSLGLLAAVLLVPMLLVEPVQAETLREEVRATVEEVLASEDFGSEETVTRWVMRDEKSSDPDLQFDGDLRWLADLLKIIAWIAVGALLVWLVVQLLRYRDRLKVGVGRRSVQAKAEAARVKIEGVLELSQLPDDIVGAVREQLQAGDLRAAVSLLYRASVSVLVHRHALELGDSATEGECLAQVNAQRPREEAEFFRRLTRLWIYIAYAERTPADADVLVLLDDWAQHYGNRGVAQ